MIAPPASPLTKAVSVQLRVFADLCRRWFDARSNGDGVDRCAAVRSRGVIVVCANGYLADRIEGELQRAGLIGAVQLGEGEATRDE